MLIWRASTRDVGAIEGRSVSDTGGGMGDIGGGGRYGHGHGRFDLDSVDHERARRATPTDGRTLLELDLRLSGDRSPPRGSFHITHHLTPHSHTHHRQRQINIVTMHIFT